MAAARVDQTGALSGPGLLGFKICRRKNGCVILRPLATGVEARGRSTSCPVLHTQGRSEAAIQEEAHPRERAYNQCEKRTLWRTGGNQ